MYGQGGYESAMSSLKVHFTLLDTTYRTVFPHEFRREKKHICQRTKFSSMLCVINAVEKENNILEVRNLIVAFDGRTVVDEVSYSLGKGKTLGIVGESGSGKSVSTMALMGLLPKNATVRGSALLGSEKGDGIELLSLDEEGFSRVRGGEISMIFQEPMTSLNPVHRCGSQVMEMLRQHENVGDEEARKRTLELFEEVLLPRPEKIFESYPHEISGGQKQRVVIAMALICKPKVIIADEPTTALDVTVQKTILDLLRQLQKRHNLSIIFITHDLGVVANIADDIAVMYHGEIVEYGAADKILREPRHPYTRGLLACRPPLEGRPERLHTVADFMSAEGERQEPAKEAPSDRKKRERNADDIILSVRNLNVSYPIEKSFFGKTKKVLNAVDDISFDVVRGETLGLVGESGCGKTTLGRALLRLVDSASGSVTFDGQRLDTLSPKALRQLRPKMQIIFQDPYSSLNPRLTVGQTIMEPLSVYAKGTSTSRRREKVKELMQRVGLEPAWYDRYPHEFSGGQRQRVCIARALVLNPELVICDESVSALDVSVQAQVLNLLNELKADYGYTYIFISHDLSVVHFISDRIMVMRAGKMIELADADKLFNKPESDYTRQLIDAIPRIEL